MTGLFYLSKMVKQKAKEWLKRYLPAEVVGTVTAVAAASIANAFQHNLLLVAYAGSLGEAIGFYSTVLIQNIVRASKRHRIANTRFSLAHLPKIVVNIVLEFGPAGVIDGLLLRPFFMYVFPILLHNFTLGILLGKIAGDITFYFLVILSYEIKKGRKKIAAT